MTRQARRELYADASRQVCSHLSRICAQEGPAAALLTAQARIEGIREASVIALGPAKTYEILQECAAELVIEGAK